ncbi:uncharacterized protein K452DRAFT_43967 [Aplosporella prunicola CBS 121167]|uniref:Uncharacterized protein n=1 Tax=Aplosporella prunicola CBS 121167 TaxID=1176127 RepID=A0A6A6B9R6_9PEZI|nr:uncharacterized protein K452DRAFT_43967 [Aplosporella prunicola CBS 121167]KAF2141012.1 hypothetical protein K452DRAFT_43967 [Aplosporella prunicola CBS 121167]
MASFFRRLPPYSYSLEPCTPSQAMAFAKEFVSLVNICMRHPALRVPRSRVCALLMLRRPESRACMSISASPRVCLRLPAGPRVSGQSSGGGLPRSPSHRFWNPISWFNLGCSLVARPHDHTGPCQALECLAFVTKHRRVLLLTAQAITIIRAPSDSLTTRALEGSEMRHVIPALKDVHRKLKIPRP